MKIMNFGKRVFKELIRDPLSIVFAIVLPVFLLFIFQQFNIPSEVYRIENFTPGIIIFGFSFITLFTSSIVANDRGTSLLLRLNATPMRSIDYILGYVVALLPIVIIQNGLFFIVALLLGLEFTVRIFLVILISLLISLLFVFLGIIIGSLVSSKGAPGVSSVVVQLVAFTSGMYFEMDMLGGFFKVLCQILPFSGCLEIVKTILLNNGTNILVPMLVTIGYTLVTGVLAVILFRRSISSDKK